MIDVWFITQGIKIIVDTVFPPAIDLSTIFPILKEVSIKLDVSSPFRAASKEEYWTTFFPFVSDMEEGHRHQLPKVDTHKLCKYIIKSKY